MSSTAQPVRPQPKPGILEIEAYVPGKESAPGVAKVHKLSSNETPLGASKAAIVAFNSVSEKLALYPDGQAHALKEAIAEVHGLNSANLLCGNGSDELLGLLCQTYLAPGDEGIFTEHGFLVYKIYILSQGATPVVAKEANETANVDAILAAVTPKTKIVFLANRAVAPLRGRAIAGARGWPEARIFALEMKPELVSISGVYRTSEEALPEAVWGHAATVRLQSTDVGDKLIFEPVKP